MTRIFIQSLADYNAGRLIGDWFDVSDMEQEDLDYAIKKVLSHSKEPFAEEVEIADHEGFYGLEPSLSNVLELAALINEYGKAYAIYAQYVGIDYATSERFEEAYCGEHSSFLDYATELFDERWSGNKVLRTGDFF